MQMFGSAAMAGELKRVIMRKPDNVMASADAKTWHYGPGFDVMKAAVQHKAFADMVAASGAQIEWLPDVADGLSDSIFTHDPSLVCGAGAIILNMGKALRKGEPGLHEALYNKMGVPVIGRLVEPGTVEGGDCIWLDAKTLVIGRGVRSNQSGIEQVAEI